MEGAVGIEKEPVIATDPVKLYVDREAPKLESVMVSKSPCDPCISTIIESGRPSLETISPLRAINSPAILI